MPKSNSCLFSLENDDDTYCSLKEERCDENKAMSCDEFILDIDDEEDGRNL